MDLYNNERLAHITRYIKPIGIRAQRASVNFEKDEVKTKKLKIYIYRLNKMLRIFLVSEGKKLAKKLKEIKKMV